MRLCTGLTQTRSEGVEDRCNVRGPRKRLYAEVPKQRSAVTSLAYCTASRGPRELDSSKVCLVHRIAGARPIHQAMLMLSSLDTIGDWKDGQSTNKRAKKDRCKNED